jgi:hypothetical protein
MPGELNLGGRRMTIGFFEIEIEIEIEIGGW